MAHAERTSTLGERPAEVDEAFAVARDRFIQQAHERFQRGYAAAVELAAHVDWWVLESLARDKFDVQQWTDGLLQDLNNAMAGLIRVMDQGLSLRCAHQGSREPRRPVGRGLETGRGLPPWLCTGDACPLDGGVRAHTVRTPRCRCERRSASRGGAYRRRALNRNDAHIAKGPPEGGPLAGQSLMPSYDGELTLQRTRHRPAGTKTVRSRTRPRT